MKQVLKKIKNLFSKPKLMRNPEDITGSQAKFDRAIGDFWTKVLKNLVENGEIDEKEMNLKFYLLHVHQMAYPIFPILPIWIVKDFDQEKHGYRMCIVYNKKTGEVRAENCELSAFGKYYFQSRFYQVVVLKTKEGVYGKD